MTAFPFLTGSFHRNSKPHVFLSTVNKRVLLPPDSKTRIYHQEYQKLLGLINPIYNEPSSFPWHPKTLDPITVQHRLYRRPENSAYYQCVDCARTDEEDTPIFCGFSLTNYSLSYYKALS